MRIALLPHHGERPHGGEIFCHDAQDIDAARQGAPSTTSVSIVSEATVPFRMLRTSRPSMSYSVARTCCVLPTVRWVRDIPCVGLGYAADRSNVLPYNSGGSGGRSIGCTARVRITVPQWAGSLPSPATSVRYRAAPPPSALSGHGAVSVQVTRSSSISGTNEGSSAGGSSGRFRSMRFAVVGQAPVPTPDQSAGVVPSVRQPEAWRRFRAQAAGSKAVTNRLSPGCESECRPGMRNPRLFARSIPARFCRARRPHCTGRHIRDSGCCQGGDT